MKLEQQVTSLDFSRCLKELGVKQESLFYWENLHEGIQDSWVVKSPNNSWNDKVSAFTVAEPGEMLPAFDIPVRDGKKGWLWLRKEHPEEFRQWEDTEVDARAKMLIYLIENRLVDLAVYS